MFLIIIDTKKYLINLCLKNFSLPLFVVVVKTKSAGLF